MKYPASIAAACLIFTIAGAPETIAQTTDGASARSPAETTAKHGPIRLAAAEPREFHQGFPPPPPPGFPPPPGHQPPPPPPGGPLGLAGFLSAWETAIGVRADQLAAWRDFTDALQAALRPPAPPDPGQRQPFALVSAIASDLSEKGRKAQALAAAIEKLKAQLTPEQLERARQMEPLAPPPPPPPPHPGGR